MTTPSIDPRPFTDAVNRLRSDGLRFQDLATRSDEARSTAWFNNLVNNRDPWYVSPPPKKVWPGLAKLFRSDVGHVRKLIAQEWFQTETASSTVSPRILGLATTLELLSEDDFKLIGKIARRLANEFEFDFTIDPTSDDK
jgi:hypothetical protein